MKIKFMATITISISLLSAGGWYLIKYFSNNMDIERINSLDANGTISLTKPDSSVKAMNINNQEGLENFSEGDHVHSETHDMELFALSGDRIFYDTPLGNKLSKIFDSLDAMDAESEWVIAQFMEQLKETPEESLAALTQAYGNLQEEQFLARYKIMYMVEHLSVAESLPFLQGIAKTSIPNNLPDYEGHGSTDYRKREVMIKMRAISGLKKLAEQGGSQPRDTLLDLIVQEEDITIKRDTIHAYLATSVDLQKDTAYITALLPQEQYALLNLNYDDVTQFQMAELEKY